MTAIEFLQSKRILPEGQDTYVLVGTFGHIELTALLNEYAQQLPGAGPITKAAVDLPKKRNTKKR